MVNSLPINFSSEAALMALVGLGKAHVWVGRVHVWVGRAHVLVERVAAEEGMALDEGERVHEHVLEEVMAVLLVILLAVYIPVVAHPGPQHQMYVLIS